MSAPSATGEGRPGVASPNDEIALDARIAQLFSELAVAPKDRRVYENAYRGRKTEFVAWLEKQFASRKPKA